MKGEPWVYCECGASMFPTGTKPEMLKCWRCRVTVPIAGSPYATVNAVICTYSVPAVSPKYLGLRREKPTILEEDEDGYEENSPEETEGGGSNPAYAGDPWDTTAYDYCAQD
jgi:hypothetical protein